MSAWDTMVNGRQWVVTWDHAVSDDSTRYQLWKRDSTGVGLHLVFADFTRTPRGGGTEERVAICTTHDKKPS